MADGGFKFSRLGGKDAVVDDTESRTGIVGDIEGDVAPKPSVVMSGGGGGDGYYNGRGVGGPRQKKKMGNTMLLLIALGAVTCLLSVVVSSLALRRVMSLSPTEKIWTFAIGESNLNLHYIDRQTLEMDGFDVDIVKSVCKVAGKKCKIVTDAYTNCWKSQKGESARGGEGLLGGWYDACVGWSQTPERRRTFAFTQPFTKTIPSMFFAYKSTNFNISDLMGEKIGFLDGYADDEHCLNNQGLKGLPLKLEQIHHYPTPAALQMALKNKEIDAIFTTVYLTMPDDIVSIKTHPPFNCSTRGRSIMTKQDSGLENWWNEAWKKVWHATYYHVMCQSLEIRHGRFPALPYENICLHL